jgi:flagellar basal-body rod protein FlgB
VHGIGDVTMATAEYALRGLATRADVRAHNLANANTPGFRAMRVDFESSLAQALRQRDVASAQAPRLEADPNLPGPNANTVSLEGELVGQMKDNLLRSAMVQSFNFKASSIRTALGRG